MAKRKYRIARGCELCMTCIYQCPVGAITLIEDVSAKIDEDKCIGCGRCRDACQPGAIIPVEVD
jgi:uncharacterized Fe-S center protein